MQYKYSIYGIKNLDSNVALKKSGLIPHLFVLTKIMNKIYDCILKFIKELQYEEILENGDETTREKKNTQKYTPIFFSF